MQNLPGAEPRPSQRSLQCPCLQRWWGSLCSCPWSSWKRSSSWDPPRETQRNNYSLPTSYGGSFTTFVFRLLGGRTFIQCCILTSLLDLSVLLFGRRRTSLKSNLTSFSMRGILESVFNEFKKKQIKALLPPTWTCTTTKRWLLLRPVSLFNLRNPTPC